MTFQRPAKMTEDEWHNYLVNECGFHWEDRTANIGSGEAVHLLRILTDGTQNAAFKLRCASARWGSPINISLLGLEFISCKRCLKLMEENYE